MAPTHPVTPAGTAGRSSILALSRSEDALAPTTRPAAVDSTTGVWTPQVAGKGRRAERPQSAHAPGSKAAANAAGDGGPLANGDGAHGGHGVRQPRPWSARTVDGVSAFRARPFTVAPPPPGLVIDEKDVVKHAPALGTMVRIVGTLQGGRPSQFCHLCGAKVSRVPMCSASGLPHVRIHGMLAASWETRVGHATAFHQALTDTVSGLEGAR